MSKRDYYTVLGDQPRRGRGRDQEGVSQARDEASSGPQSGRQDLRSEIQGSEGGVRGPLGRPQAGRVRPVRTCRRRRRGRDGRRARRAGRLRRLRRRVRRHLRRDLRPAAGTRRPRQRRVSRCRPSLQPRAFARGRGARRRGQDPHSDDGGVRDLPRHGREAGYRAQAMPDLPRPRRGARVAGLLLDPADVPDVPRTRQGRRRAVRRVPRRGSHEEAARRCR